MADTSNPKPARTRTRKKKSAKKTVAPVKPTIVHTKRKEIEGEDGWIHIVDKPRTNQLGPKAKKLPLQGGDFELKGVSYVNRTLVEMREEFEHWQRSWEDRPTCQLLKEKMKDVEKDRKIENVVVLGLGSLQSARREGRRSSATQLAALQTIVDGLQNGPDRQIIFQDPQFTRMDKEFLTTLGYKVLDDPEAFAEVGEGSLVYAIHCYAQVYKSVADRPRPAILIGTDVGTFARFDASEDITVKELEKMVEGYEIIDFPQLRHDFSDTKIYLRPATQLQPTEVKSAQQDTHRAAIAVTQSTVAETTQIEIIHSEAAEVNPSREASAPKPDTEAVESTATEASPTEATQTEQTAGDSSPEAEMKTAQEEAADAQTKTPEPEISSTSTVAV